MRIGSIIIFHLSKTQALHTVWCNISDEAAGKIWNCCWPSGIWIMAKSRGKRKLPKPWTSWTREAPVDLFFVWIRSPGFLAVRYLMSLISKQLNDLVLFNSTTSLLKRPPCGVCYSMEDPDFRFTGRLTYWLTHIPAVYLPRNGGYRFC